MKKEGNINVQTENIFPIIKKFLYSDHEIFLRELVSNAVDATQKMKTLKIVGELKVDISKLRVEVILDKEKKTITVRDNGIGMTHKELDKYINQIAFSGAEEFVNKYKDKDDKHHIIGHFGLGFYSAFMVAKEVEIVTKSQQPNSKAVKWTCDGSPSFKMEGVQKKTKGTDTTNRKSKTTGLEYISRLGDSQKRHSVLFELRTGGVLRAWRSASARCRVLSTGCRGGATAHWFADSGCLRKMLPRQSSSAAAAAIVGRPEWQSASLGQVYDEPFAGCGSRLVAMDSKDAASLREE